MPPTENNHQGNQRLLLVRNSAVEAENKTIKIKVALQTEIRSLHPKIFMGMLTGNPSTQMSGLGSRFHSEECNSRIAEAMVEYELASAEEAYGDPREQVPMGFMSTGGRFYDGNVSHCWDQKKSSLNSQNCSDNTNWETAVVHMSMEE